MEMARLVAKQEQRLAQLEARGNEHLAELDAMIDRCNAELELKSVRRYATLGFWLIQLATIVVTFAVVRLAL